MHAYASAGGGAVLGHPASDETVGQTFVPGGTDGVVAATNPVVAVDLLVLGVDCGAVFPEHADADTRTTQTATTTRPMDRRTRT